MVAFGKYTGLQKMLSELVLNSELVYPPIVRTGSVSFSKGSAPTVYSVTSLTDEEDYILYVEENGVLRVPAYNDLIYNSTTAIYRVGGELYLYFNDFASRSGTIHWRIYGARP